MTLSKQQTERLGIAYIVEQIYRSGLMFAVPVQVKAFSDEEFYSDQKYLKIDGLFIIYLWYVGTGDPIKAFGMKYLEVEKIVDRQGWTRHEGTYAITRGTKPLK